MNHSNAPYSPHNANCRAGHAPERSVWVARSPSAAQSAVFNAVFDARSAAGLLHTLRAGDVARTPRGGSFVCAEEDLADANRRAAPGTLELFATGPLPGRDRLPPSEKVAAEERDWSAHADIDAHWLAPGGQLASAGERRA